MILYTGKPFEQPEPWWNPRLCRRRTPRKLKKRIKKNTWCIVWAGGPAVTGA